MARICDFNTERGCESDAVAEVNHPNQDGTVDVCQNHLSLFDNENVTTWF